MERSRRKSVLPKRFEGFELHLQSGEGDSKLSTSTSSMSTNDVPSVYIQIHLQSSSNIGWSEIPPIVPEIDQPDVKPELEVTVGHCENTIAVPKARNRGGRPRGSRGKKFLLQRNLPDVKPELEVSVGNCENTIAVPKARNRGGRPRGSRGKKFLLQRNSPEDTELVNDPLNSEVAIRGSRRGRKFGSRQQVGSGTAHTPEEPFHFPLDRTGNAEMTFKNRFITYFI
jgi:hypothetical protein